MSEQELTGEALAQAMYNKIVEAAKQLQPEGFKDFGKCTGLIIIGFQGGEYIFAHRIGMISEYEASKYLYELAVQRVISLDERERPGE